MIIFAIVKLGRIAFYIITLITISEVTTLSLQFRQDALVSFSNDWLEGPLEEDETRETEDEDDLFCFSVSHGPAAVLNTENGPDQRVDDLPEPLHSIVVPPPQG